LALYKLIYILTYLLTSLFFLTLRCVFAGGTLLVLHWYNTGLHSCILERYIQLYYVTLSFRNTKVLHQTLNPTAELWFKTLSRIKVNLVLHQT